MKKLFCIILLSLAIAGCSKGNNTEHQATENKIAKNNQTNNIKQVIKNDIYVPSPQVTDDRNLVKKGETITDTKGELTLIKYKKVNREIRVGPVEMMIKDVKVMQYIPDYSMIDFFHSYTHDEEFNFIKVALEFKNTSRDTIKFNPIAFLKLNTGEHKTWEEDIYLENLLGEIEPNSVKKGKLGFIIKNTKEMNWVELLTSDVVNKNGEIIEKAKNIKINF